MFPGRNEKIERKKQYWQKWPRLPFSTKFIANNIDIKLEIHQAFWWKLFSPAPLVQDSYWSQQNTYFMTPSPGSFNPSTPYSDYANTSFLFLLYCWIHNRVYSTLRECVVTDKCDPSWLFQCEWIWVKWLWWLDKWIQTLHQNDQTSIYKVLMGTLTHMDWVLRVIICHITGHLSVTIGYTAVWRSYFLYHHLQWYILYTWLHYCMNELLPLSSSPEFYLHIPCMS